MKWGRGKIASSLAICLILGQTALAFPKESQREGRVHWVIDGDTFELETGERIRLIGVDTPEYQPWKNRIHFYGKEASAFSKNILNGKKVLLESDVEEKDRYGRTLAYVYLENGLFVNQTLVENGFARAKYYAPNGRYRKLFKETEQNAKKLKKGMWGALDNSLLKH